MKILPVSIMLSFLFASGLVVAADPVSQVKTKIEGGAKIVDVRTPGEFDSGHYKGADNIPLQEMNSRLAEFGDKTKPIVVYCRSGRRSAEAKRILLENGYKDVTDGGGLADMP
ncbi:MAG TPA: rhodanese-like domain-containing protein [Spirochaetota bacterium]|nr:rhodanese-like domain-containing protein [Spirochaetota bacterium]